VSLGLKANLNLHRKQFVEETAVGAAKRPDTPKLLKEIPPKGYPNRILSSKEHFDQLYRLMNYGDSIGKKVGSGGMSKKCRCGNF
jgi:hypothetical protein